VSGYNFTLAILRALNFMMELIPERLAVTNTMPIILQMTKDILNVSDQLLTTYPPTKQKAIMHHARCQRLKLVGVNAPTGSKEYTSIDTKTLEVLVNKAHDTCLLCSTPERCKSCELGRAFDACCAWERLKGESWADIDVSRV